MRLLPYHPVLNPIELIRARVKNWVAAHNKIFKIQDVIKLCVGNFNLVGEKEWRRVCAHVQKIEDEYMDKERTVDNETENLIIQLGRIDVETNEDGEDTGSVRKDSDSDGYSEKDD